MTEDTRSRFSVAHTHLFPGAALRRLEGRGEGPCTLSLSDGVEPTATLEGHVLRVAGYTTAAGTRIGEQAWALDDEADGFRVTGRLDPA
ncbi:hypothetical protein SAMN04490244_104231 [Tranquillimonas rosea]|uniref:Uncharacterized protein n=1 Tax=Tranquillimonas rosea TaxID=641238 RepID=A0A1H9TK59_9RHOB|nr:hypothetical protein [Tranquillimonas rosea]SER97492.1 hypothetical protein SAMN04490244_104231 [Tranquillimonas rosea]